MNDAAMTIGIEEEYQIIGKRGELIAQSANLLPLKEANEVQLRTDVMQAVIEGGTGVCLNVEQAFREIARSRAAVSHLAVSCGMRVMCAGTHPFARWQSQTITEGDRYRRLVDRLQDVVRQLLIFGLHIHIGLPSLAQRLDIMNDARYFVPHLIALSTSSPFWSGRDTGLKSYRSIVWSQLPHTGIPPTFRSESEYQMFIDTMIDSGSLADGSEIWWDIRCHPRLPTIEFRCCDQPTRIEETMCLAALVQGIVAKLARLRERNMRLRSYCPALIGENRWRAIRYGVGANYLVPDVHDVVSVRDLALGLLDFIDDELGRLGARDAAQYVLQIVDAGTSADRQLQVFERTGSLEAVVAELAKESLEGIDAG